MNVGTFSGRIGRDAELRHAKNGDAVTNFSLAVDVGTKDSPRTLWIDCVLWGKRAESLTQYLQKGTKVTTHGRVDMSEYQKKDGTQGAKLQVTVSDIDLHGGGGEQSSAAAPAQRQSRPVQKNVEDFEDDVPF
jgi:single-strand DNA-binding protein